MSVFDKNFKEIFSFQIISIAGGLIAGIILAIFTDKLFVIPAILILLPGFLEMRGNISGTLAARISSGLFLCLIDPYKKNLFRTKIIKGNLMASFLLVIFISLILGFIAFSFSYLVFNIFIPQIILLSLIGGIIANIIEIPITLFMTLYLFKKGHDPNNIMGPLVTSTGDIISIISLLIALIVI